MTSPSMSNESCALTFGKARTESLACRRHGTAADGVSPSAGEAPESWPVRYGYSWSGLADSGRRGVP